MGALAVGTPGPAHTLCTGQVPYLEPHIALYNLFTVRTNSGLRDDHFIQRQLIENSRFAGASHPNQDYLEVLFGGEVAVQPRVDRREILTHL